MNEPPTCTHIRTKKKARSPCGSCGRIQLDRKSTRLNSSHANISYAVFCLKKNNPDHPPPAATLSLHTRRIGLGVTHEAGAPSHGRVAFCPGLGPLAMWATLLTRVLPPPHV